MTLTEITHLILETVREGHVVDDERLSHRVIKDWVTMKRSQYIKNMRGGGGTSGTLNPNGEISLAYYQKIPVTVQVKSSVEDAGDYPFINTTTQLYKVVESTATIPSIVNGRLGPMIMSIESEDEMKLPFSHVSYNQMQMSGNGRFNHALVYGSIRDNKLWFKYNSFFDNYTNVIIRAVLENPTDLSGFNEETDEYPADPGLIEYIKNGIFDKDIRMFYAGRADEISDSSGEILT